jgi:hypothetical protein
VLLSAGGGIGQIAQFTGESGLVSDGNMFGCHECDFRSRSRTGYIASHICLYLQVINSSPSGK